MRYVSLFAGIGGFDLALSRLGHECVYANEWDKYAAQIYEKNFCHSSYRSKDGGEQENQEGNDETGEGLESEKGEKIANEKRPISKHSNSNTGHGAVCCIDRRSITDVPASVIPDHELLVGGFPCQAFSIAGKRRGFEDTRGTLFFDIARILKAKRPAYLLLENVKGLLSHDSGRTFKTIIAALVELRYDLQWQVLNSKNFGVPQNRERVFIIGHLRGQPRPKVFPLRENSQSDIVLPTLTARYYGAQANGSYIRTITAAATELKYVGGIVGEREMWLRDGKQNSRNFSQGQRVYSADGIGVTLAGNAGGMGGKTGLYQLKDMKIRRLTPLECERLQGFPDGWTEGISDTQRYKCLGNAVTVNVVEEIMRRFNI